MARRLLGTLAAVGALVVIGVGPASAITGGQADGSNHPYVGVMIAYNSDDNPLWACSGTLMSPTVFLTAGHCIVSTDGVQADHVGIWFDSGQISENPAYYENHSCSDGAGGVLSGFPCSGTPVTATSSHLYTLSGSGAFVTHDLGVVQLASGDAITGLDEYGVLPSADQLDSLKTQRGRQDETFTTVGYGMQQSFSGAAAGTKDVAIPERLSTTTHLVQIDGGGAGDFGVILSDNASTGGMCFGDSGGPNLIVGSNVVAAVSSAVTDNRCTGTSLAFRLDRETVIDWLARFGVKPPSS